MRWNYIIILKVDMITATVTVVWSDLSCRWTKQQNLKKDDTKLLQENLLIPHSLLLIHNPTIERKSDVTKTWQQNSYLNWGITTTAMATWKGRSDFVVLACYQALHVWRPSHSRLPWRAILRVFSRLPQIENLLAGYHGIINFKPIAGSSVVQCK